ncbi:hypothetical protein DENSPDRAFT_796979 [Dentipellis sp. KUC8613]|nr:hypothetical protein DENSPDRAFT_796979 [Dentipellis sp. KUC8613]
MRPGRTLEKPSASKTVDWACRLSVTGFPVCQLTAVLSLLFLPRKTGSSIVLVTFFTFFFCRTGFLPHSLTILQTGSGQMTSALGPDIERELISAIQSTYATKYLSAIGLVALIYDHILTLPDEIRLIWKAPRSFAKWAFLANRYIVALCLILVANELCGFNMIEFSSQVCKGFLSTMSMICVCSISLANVLVLHRVLLLWDFDRVIVRTAIVGFVLTTMSTVGTMIGAVVVLAPSVQWNPVVQTCVVTTTTSWYIAVWIPPMIYEFLIFGLSTYSSFSRPRDGNAKMANILHEDGLLFFFVLLILRLVNIGFAAKGDPSRTFMVSYFVWSLFTITLNRCLLSIRASEVALARSPNAPEDPCVGLFSMTGRASPIQVELGDWDPLESPAPSEKALERLPARRLFV